MKNRNLKAFTVVLIAVSFLLLFSLGALGAEAGGTPLGLAPSAYESEKLPEAYCMRDDYVVLTQNQDVHGYCWNFASTTAAATTIMKATCEYYDFSELWTGVAARITGTYNKLGAGGGFGTHTSAMQSAGLMLETDLPYQSSYITSNENADDYYNFHYKYANDDIANCLSPTSFKQENVDEIKEHIYNHGSVYMAFSFRSGFIQKGDAYYLTPNQKNTTSSHAISVIGWDDNYEQELLVDGSDTPRVYKGAWIVMNSYTETNSKDGIAFIFYEDTNITSLNGYKYAADTEKDFYFYDKIETGYTYPTSVVGKYYGDFVAKSGFTKQKNIFYDDVFLTYSYLAPSSVRILDIDIYLGTEDVTDRFDVKIDGEKKKFCITKSDAQYGQYKILITYTNGEKTDTYLNNFFVTYGLFGEGVELDNDKNDFAFNTGHDLEFYGFTAPDKNYVIYTNKLSGELFFLPRHQSVYSEKNTSLPSVSYEIKDGISDKATYTLTSPSGYGVDYIFNFEYYEDTTLETVYVYYDLGGGVNHEKNYRIELANATTDLVLYEPTREGYTFAGWYLDYRNGTKKIDGENGMYYVSWEDINHLGESPSLSALSHYKKFYNNSSTVFVYARWEEIEYYDVEVNITGNGSVQLSERISVSSDDAIHYIFKYGFNSCLSSLEINGVPVSYDKLADIAKKGLRLERLNGDVTLNATFSDGILVLINTGENIKSAYLTRKENGKTVKYYNGNCIPISGNFRPTAISNLTLVVEVFDDTDEYTYILEDVDEYDFESKGKFTKSAFFVVKKAMIEVSVGSAIPKKISKVNLTYNVSEYVLEHYVSIDPKALKADEKCEYLSGETVYLFIKVPADTAEYDYVIDEEFVSVGRDWYRRTICVDPDKADLGNINVERVRKSYTVVWRNWDGTLIARKTYEYGEIPVCQQIPTRPDDGELVYTFVGWSPTVSAVEKDVTYKAQFTSSLREYTINAEAATGGKVSPDGQAKLTSADTRTYTFLPDEGYRIKDVTINGISVGAVPEYTVSGVLENKSINVIFERITFALVVNCGDYGSIDFGGLTTLEYGSEITVKISADEGYCIDYIKINGEVADIAETLTISNITGDVNIEAGFKPNPPPREDALPWYVVTIIVSSSVVVAIIVAATVVRLRGKRKNNESEQ